VIPRAVRIGACAPNQIVNRRFLGSGSHFGARLFWPITLWAVADRFVVGAYGGRRLTCEVAPVWLYAVACSFKVG
jgi:hypothetical protein